MAWNVHNISHHYNSPPSPDPAARDPETPVIAVAQGREPPHFTGFFPHWKQSMWKVSLRFRCITDY